MRFAKSVLTGLMLASAGIAVAQTVRDGVEAWGRGDYETAVKDWRPLAASDGDAAFDLAQAYKLGRGVPIDLAQAKTLYGQAARAGHVQGAANYGLLLFQDGDRKSAMPWIQKAAEAGDPRAQYVYGTALFNGDLVGKDWPRAYAMMTRAAAAGLPQATTSLSQMDQFLSPADRTKGQQIASTLAAQPVPPIGRQIVTGGGPTSVASAAPRGIAPTSLPPSSSPSDVAAGAVYPGEPAPAPARKGRGARVAQAAPPPAPVPAAPSGIGPQPDYASMTAAPPPAPAPAPAPMARPAPIPRSAPAPRRAPAPAPVAAPALATGGHWQVQLGAYSSEAAARSAWGAVAGRLHGLTPSFEKAGPVVRLRATGLADRGAAARACAAAKPAACFPVAP